MFFVCYSKTFFCATTHKMRIGKQDQNLTLYENARCVSFEVDKLAIYQIFRTIKVNFDETINRKFNLMQKMSLGFSRYN